jgi:hypothetical protein
VNSVQQRGQKNSRKGRYQQMQESNSSRGRGQDEYVPPAAADIVRNRSATACSRWRCSLLASAKAFSAFFALASADLCDFSAFALAAIAISKAFREALSLASSDTMRALADARASAVQQRKERKSQINSKEKHTGQEKTGQRSYLRKLSQPSNTLYTQCPRQRISSSMPDKGRTYKYMEGARKISAVQPLTSSGEPMGSCASRETLAS